MRHLYSDFPVALPGLGLVILRVVLATFLLVDGAVTLGRLNGSDFDRMVLGTLPILLALCLASGLLTPVASLLAILADLGSMAPLVWVSSPVRRDAAVLRMAIALALICIGPGAYSIDRRLFGRVEIVIRPRTAGGRLAGAPPRK